MRYINIHELELPNGWEDKAKKLSEDLKNATTDKERADIMEQNPIWRDLFVPLSKLSKGKCWYSECREVMSDKDVDHFRPKNEAINLDEVSRNGYWWLAYDWENYRFSSIYSNRIRYDKFDEKSETGGKGAYFPLFPGSPVADKKSRLKDEDIMLLDPTDEDDPCLLTFDDLGEAIPYTSNPKDIQRVKVSKRFYHLDHTPLKEERQKVWNRCQRLIDDIERLSSETDVSISDKATIKSLKNRLKEMVQIDEELSAVSLACVEHNKMARLLRA